MRFPGRVPPRLAREDSPEQVPRKILTPVYPRDPARPRRRRDVTRTVDDLLVELMFDGEYREIAEVVRHLPRGRWTDGLEGCVRRGYAFDRDGSLLRLRRRGVTERRQTLSELLEGLSPEVLVGGTPSSRSVSRDDSGDEGAGEGEGGLDSGESSSGGLDVVAGPVPAGPVAALSEGEDPLTLPLPESATMTCAILAKKSSGKTYLGMVIVEEILRSGAGVPVVVVDPTGVWAPGLRCMADGTPSSYQVLTLGGPHADLPISRSQGRAAAEVVGRLRPHPVVLDLSDMSPAEQHEVVADFGEGIFATEERSPLLLVLDEADEFAPQVVGSSSHQRRSLEILDRIVRRGRIKGLGTVLITQRAAVVNKNVLSQIDKLFLLCMVAPSDLDAVEDWLRHVVPVGQRSKCLGQLPSLQPGQAFYMAGGAAAAFRKFSVRRRGTYDSSRTPTSARRGGALELSHVSPEVLETARRIMESVPVEEGGS